MDPEMMLAGLLTIREQAGSDEEYRAAVDTFLSSKQPPAQASKLPLVTNKKQPAKKGK